MTNTRRVFAALALTGAVLSVSGVAHATGSAPRSASQDGPGSNQAFIDEYVLDIDEFYSKKSDRLPRYADALISKIKDDPEIIDIIKTTILFNKGRFEGPHS
ncbi:hypothetical protein ACFWC9_38815 [Streptomyces goshikiensis]|uniref:hypothetical protein n=1 Tax=Streptomyces goshikiensis TaxID=1942 RepID=UPI0036C330A6